MAELLKQRPELARRTAQRLIAQLIKNGEIRVLGQARARRYFSAITPSGTVFSLGIADSFPHFIPLSEDSRGILNRNLNR